MAPFSNIVVSSSLCLLSVAGFYSTWILLMNNGTADLMKHIRDVGPRLLPGSQELIKTSYTGMEWIDSQLGVLTLFFWEMIDGSRPHASLFSFYFGGQLAAGWCVFMIEGLRNGNRWRAVSFVTLWGLAVQKLSFAVSMPIYMAIHLLTSPTVSSRQSRDFVFNVSELASIPLSMLIGYGVPAILLALPAPSILNFDRKQAFMAAWQVFPVWVLLLQQALPPLIAQCGTARKYPKEDDHVNQQWISTARVVYTILFFFAGAVHISTMALIASSELFPGLYKPERPFDFSGVFLPVSISASIKMPSIGSGALQLLQYDFYVGATAFAIWTSTILLNTKRGGGSLWVWFTQILEAIFLTALVGPFGYGIACIWSRDELVFAKNTDDAKKER